MKRINKKSIVICFVLLILISAYIFICSRKQFINSKIFTSIESIDVYKNIEDDIKVYLSIEDENEIIKICDLFDNVQNRTFKIDLDDGEDRMEPLLRIFVVYTNGTTEKIELYRSSCFTKTFSIGNIVFRTGGTSATLECYLWSLIEQ